MKSILRLLGTGLLAAAAAACASGGGDTDSESHFLCHTDADCTEAGERTECVASRCQRPASSRSSLEIVADEDPGPALDCETEWPADAVSFEWSEDRLPRSETGNALAMSRPRLNRNGTVIVAQLDVRDLEPGRYDGHLIRWAGNHLAWLGQAPEGSLAQPLAVSCDGYTIAGRALASNQAYRWTPAGGFEKLTGADAVPVPYEVPSAISADGSVIFGVRTSGYPFPTDRSQAVSWSNGLTAPLFAMPATAGAEPGWSGDGSRLACNLEFGQPFLQSVGSEALSLDLPGDGAGSARAISFDGKVVAGQQKLRGYVWNDGRLEWLPEAVEVGAITAVTPQGVVVGNGMWQGSDLNSEELIWDRTHGPRKLRELLAENGVTIPARLWDFKLTDISADGRVITGVCFDRDLRNDENALNQPKLFRAVLPAGALD